MLNEKSLIRKLQQVKPELIEKYSVKTLGYFGSYADGSMTEQSDIDILVDFSKPVGYEFFRVQEELEKVFKKRIDLVTPSAIRPQLKESIYKLLKFV
jgi:uncharacterized protein